MEKISKEKLDWMQEVGIKEFEEPMKYYSSSNWLYSEKYIRETPLEELRARYDINLIEKREPITDDAGIR